MMYQTLAVTRRFLVAEERKFSDKSMYKIEESLKNFIGICDLFRTSYRTDIGIWKDGCLEILRVKLKEEVVTMMIGKDMTLFTTFVVSILH